MAKIKNPLFSFAATGSVGKLCYSSAPSAGIGAHIARSKPRAPSTGQSSAQLFQTDRFKAARDGWHALDSQTRALWSINPSSPRIVGFALYVREWMIQECDPGEQPKIPDPGWVGL